MRLPFSLLLALLLCVPAKAQQRSPVAREAVQTINQLRAIGLPKDTDFKNGPPALVPGLLRKLNQQLRELISESLNSKSPLDTVDEDDLLSALRTAGWEEIAPSDWNAYGEIIDIDLDWKSGYNPELLVVSTKLWIPCGHDPDSAIYIFQGKAGDWKLVLAVDADYDAVGGGPEETGVQYELSPQDANGKWFLAIARTPPSCRQSRYGLSYLSYEVLRPGRSPSEPTVLLKTSQKISSLFDPPFELRTAMNWTGLTTGRIRRLDGQPGASIFRYEVGYSEVHRMQPFAANPMDFLDEWVQLSWDDAQRWTNISELSDLEGWHTKLSKLSDASAEFQSLTQCPDKQDFDNKWLLELWIDPKMNPSRPEESLFVTINEKGGAYFVQDIREKRPKGCTGKAKELQPALFELPRW